MSSHTSTPSQRRKLSKNPFKAPSPILKRQQQKPLNFFLQGRSKSSLEPKTKPLEDATGSDLNIKSTSQPPRELKTSSMNFLARTSSSFDTTDEDDDVVEVDPPIKNFKNSKPPASRMLSSSSLPSTSALSFTTPRETVDLSTERDTMNETHVSHTDSRKPSQFKPLVTLAKLRSGGQQTLNFGSKKLAPAKRALNPWDQTSKLTKTKNPRLRATPPAQTDQYHRSITSDLKLSDEQKLVLELVVRKGLNVFYTGSAGTGKSLLLREIISALNLKHGSRAVAVAASTGLAAVNIGGSTINRLSGMGIGDRTPQAYISMIRKKPEVKERWRLMKVLIIDEISMLDGSFLDKLNQVAQGVRNYKEPFGGVQLVLTGDFFQLPPVPDKNRAMKFCFQAQSWKYINRTILLHKVFRQADSEFVNILNAVRLANIDDEMSSELARLSRPVVYEDGIQPTELYSTRNEVEYSNRKRLAALPGRVKKFTANDIAPDDRAAKMLENTMAVKELELKIGAQVMMLKNIDETLVNGSVGVVWGYLSSEQYTELRTAFLLSSDDPLDGNEGKKIIDLIQECNAEGHITEETKRYIEQISSMKKRQSAVKKAAEFSSSVTEAALFPVVRFKTPAGGRIFLAEPDEFQVSERGDDSHSVIARKQVPLLLSWALSIHKAQGQTLNYVRVDLNRVFEAGQVYVALSRAVSKENLQILNFHPDKIRVNPDVKRFYSTLEKLDSA